ncbi:MAG: cobalamin B12-binding domain-containing protein [Nitrospirae bacterium]|nr:cobalamin B12-binding domain-containing protein [Nitrospirota bacterium]
MKIKIIYPKWPKLNRQTEFHLPPHGPVCFAAAIPNDIEISFYDENIQPVDFDGKADLAAFSVMLTCQIPRAWELAGRFRKQGIPVIFGGIGTMLHHEETLRYADSVFLGEAEGRFEEVLNDVKNNSLKKIYNYLNDFPDMSLIGPARRSNNWEKELFKALIPLKKKWISHPIKDDDDILDLAAEAGCWYVYQAVFDTSDVIRQRIRRLKERGIGVEGTIILGMDDHDEDYIKRLVDFLLEVELDLAEFTILTPFPHSPIRAALEKQKRILHNDWLRYTGAEVVFKPAKMSAEALQKMFFYAWDEFYRNSSQNLQMAKMFLNVIEKEKADGTYKGTRLRRGGWKAGK